MMRGFQEDTKNIGKGVNVEFVVIENIDQ